MEIPHDPHCSFCRKSYHDVGPLVEGEGPGNVYICAECAELCQSIIVQEKYRRRVTPYQLPSTLTERYRLTLAELYRPATDKEVHSWSFGSLKSIRFLAATNWEQQRGTLDDQSIFGPRKDLECACGKYQGPRHRNMICDICGVKVTSLDARRQRFGHIDMPVSIEHPLGDKGEHLSTIPVLPAAYFESSGGTALRELYDELILAVISESQEGLRVGWNRLVELLVPVLIIAQKWNLQEARTIARGLALELRATENDVRCEHCGYPLAGLFTFVCPACGKQASS